jgi:hypothetical protein
LQALLRRSRLPRITGGLPQYQHRNLFLDVYGINLKVINMETAAVAMSYPADITKSTRIETLLASGSGPVPGGRVVTQTPAQTAPVQTSAQPVPAQVQPAGTYKVGDKDPAGGLIFYPASFVTISPPPVNRAYESGNTSPAGGIIFYINPQAGDWKYLETAPANTEKETFWAAEDFPSADIDNSRAVGTGKFNATYIMKHVTDRGGGFDWAAEVCDSLVVNGYDDWFLPSRDELHQMYGNLVRRGLGEFKGDWYWSSTANGKEGRYAWRENFTDGTQNSHVASYVEYGKGHRSRKYRVRAIRQF